MGAQLAYIETSKQKSALPKMIVTGYHELNMIHFFTAGEKEALIFLTYFFKRALPSIKGWGTS